MALQLIYKGLAGSQLYGTATEKSDTDYVEVYLPSRGDIFGLGDKYNKLKQTTGDEDFQRFTLNTYMRLLRAGNPNVLETLFCPADRVVYAHDAWPTLVRYASEMLSKTSVVKAHLGFAIQQTNKMLPAKAKDAGARRKTLFDKYGYDVKYAAHAIRLCHQCVELLNRGTITFPYQIEFVDHLLDIRNGKFSLQEVQEEFTAALAKVEKIEQSCRVLNDSDKTFFIDVHLINFYQAVGYAQ